MARRRGGRPSGGGEDAVVLGAAGAVAVREGGQLPAAPAAAHLGAFRGGLRAPLRGEVVQAGGVEEQGPPVGGGGVHGEAAAVRGGLRVAGGDAVRAGNAV